jgi:hypothetical protein
VNTGYTIVVLLLFIFARVVLIQQLYIIKVKICYTKQRRVYAMWK